MNIFFNPKGECKIQAKKSNDLSIKQEKSLPQGYNLSKLLTYNIYMILLRIYEYVISRTNMIYVHFIAVTFLIISVKDKTRF